MGTWNSRGLRGSTLEDMINHSNEVYREKKLALIQMCIRDRFHTGQDHVIQGQRGRGCICWCIR